MIDLDLDISLLATIIHKNEYLDVVNKDLLAKESLKILKDFEEYRSTTDEISLESFSNWFIFNKNAGMLKDELVFYKNVISKIKNTKPKNIEEIINGLEKSKLWDKLIKLKVSGFNVGDMQELLAQYKSVDKDKKEDFIGGDIHKASELLRQDEGLQWRISNLNKIVGPLTKGIFTLAVAYHNVGKSAFAVSEAAYMATQLPDDQCVLYFNNEEHDARLVYRFYQSILGTTIDKILSHKDKAKDAYIKILGNLNKIKIIDSYSKPLGYLAEQCQKHNPGLIIIDQIDNLAHNSEGHRPYNDLYSKVRQLAKTYAPIIGLSQAAGTAKYINQETREELFVEWLGDGQIHHSRVDKQGANDVLITIGRSNSDDTIRNFQVHRCKMNGNTGKFRVKLKNSIMRMEDASVQSLNEEIF